MNNLESITSSVEWDCPRCDRHNSTDCSQMNLRCPDCGYDLPLKWMRLVAGDRPGRYVEADSSDS